MDNETHAYYTWAACHALHCQQHGVSYTEYEAMLFRLDARLRKHNEEHGPFPIQQIAWRDTLHA